MNKSTKMMMKAKKARGASMVEYGVLLFAVIITAAAAIKNIGPKVRAAGDRTVGSLEESK